MWNRQTQSNLIHEANHHIAHVHGVCPAAHGCCTKYHAYLQQHTSRYKIVFIYDDLEDYKVTTTVKNKSVPDAIRQMIGFYPIKMTRKENREIYVEAILKTERRLKGVVVDEHNLPMPYANVTLLNPADSTMVGGGVTNESGRFVIPIEHGKVIARVTYVGYKPAYRLCSRDNVGTIKMYPDITALKETVVTAAKMQIEATHSTCCVGRPVLSWA